MRFVLDSKELIMPGGDAAGHKKRGEGVANDYRASSGTPIHMPWNGLIQYWFGGSQDAGGYWISFKDKDGNSIQLAHLSSRVKHPGEYANEGDIIGYTGNTGTSTTGPHLHLQIIKPNGSRIDPANYSWGNPQGGTVTQEQKDYEKAYVLFEYLYGERPKSDQIVKDYVAHYNGIRQAGKTEEEAWHQIYLENKPS